MPVVVLTGSGTWSLPSDWNDANNTIEIYAAGGNGANGTSSTSGGGGGGGGYIKATNAPLAAAIAAGVFNNLGYGPAGFNTIFGNVTTGYDSETLDPITATFLAASWGSNASGITGGSGGNGARNNPIGFTVAALNRAGGLGGNGRSSTTAAGGGGGGAAGPNGNGANGGANSTTSGTVGRGGGGANGGTAGSGTSATAGVGANGGGSGGTGGTASSGSAGSAGTTVYSGGGGGGAADGNAAYVGGAGGGYGGGGGGAGATTGSTGGAGAPAIIVITYSPAGQSTLQATESGSDTAQIGGDVIVQGTIVLGEANADTAHFAQSARGNLIATEARDTASVVGKVIVDGPLDATEGAADTAYFSRAKRVVLIPTIGSTTSFTLPGDWSDAGSVIEVYGRGGKGSDFVSSASGGGGGGGAYLRITGANYPLKSALASGELATINYTDTGNSAGGGFTTFGTHAYGSAIVVQNGSAGSSGTAGSAGLAANSYASFGYSENAATFPPQAVFSGGTGGAGRGSTAAGGGGGGGGAGPSAAGGNGAANITATGSNGGAGGAAGGGGFAGAGGAGGNDTLLTPGVAGESYGGGGGGAHYLTGALGGAGGSSAIILTYFPTNYMATGEASGDTLSASGSVTGVGDAGVTGDLAATEQGADAASASGKVPVKGSLSATEARDTAALTGGVSAGGAVSGSLSATEARDTAAFVSLLTLLTSTKASWPQSLPTYVQEQGYAEDLEIQTIQTTMDAGLANIRRRFTAPVRRFQITIELTSAQSAVFETFYRDTLAGGLLPFDWRHPRTGSVTRFRFRKPAPKLTVVGGEYVRASFTLESIPP